MFHHSLKPETDIDRLAAGESRGEGIGDLLGQIRRKLKRIAPDRWP